MPPMARKKKNPDDTVTISRAVLLALDHCGGARLSKDPYVVIEEGRAAQMVKSFERTCVIGGGRDHDAACRDAATKFSYRLRDYAARLVECADRIDSALVQEKT